MNRSLSYFVSVFGMHHPIFEHGFLFCLESSQLWVTCTWFRWKKICVTTKQDMISMKGYPSVDYNMAISWKFLQSSWMFGRSAGSKLQQGPTAYHWGLIGSLYFLPSWLTSIVSTEAYADGTLRVISIQRFSTSTHTRSENFRSDHRNCIEKDVRTWGHYSTLCHCR